MKQTKFNGQMAVLSGVPQQYPPKNLIQLFEEKVSKYPNHIACIFNDTQIIYLELNHSANQLAHFILGNEKKTVHR